MVESFKAVISLFVIVALIVASVAWLHDRPDRSVWLARIVSSLVLILSIAVLIKLQFRKDIAPDLLFARCGGYFNRGGFCFAFEASDHNGVCLVTAVYQNQRDAACHGQIAIRPSRGFFLTRAKIDAITFDVQCQPGEFGTVSVPVPIAEKLQGKNQGFDVGAACKYVSGKGKRLRFRDGIFLRSDSKFGSSFSTALTLLGAAGGMVVLSRPATAKILLPRDVATEVDDSRHYAETQWVYAPDALDRSAAQL